MFDTPILLIIFNRIDTTRQVFDQIKKIEPSRLFISADGPRPDRSMEKEKCEAVRRFVVESITWPCQVETNFQDTNLGCKYAVSGAIKWFFSIVEMGIILEDDCYPSLSFFNYCERLLLEYRNEPRVGMISGHNYFGTTPKHGQDYTFITTCGVWGWASWRRVILDYSPDYSKLLDHKLKSIRTICVKRRAGETLLENSCKAATNQMNTWDYQFCEHLITNGMLTIMPTVNLIRNLGFLEDSTHTAGAPFWYKDEIFEYDKPLQISRHIRVNRKLSTKIERFHITKKTGMIKKIIRRIKRIITSCRETRRNKYISKIRYLDGFAGERKRYAFYKSRLRYLGKNVRIDTGVFIYGEQWVSIGDGTHIDKNSIIIGSPSNLDLSNRAVREKVIDEPRVKKGEVVIGNDCHISQNTMIYGYGGVLIGNNCVLSTGAKIYSLTSMPTNPNDASAIISIVPYSGISPTLIGKVVLGNNVWVGIDTVISPGVRLGENSFVRSNSFVLESFEGNSHIGGDPAKYIKPRFVTR